MKLTRKRALVGGAAVLAALAVSGVALAAWLAHINVTGSAATGNGPASLTAVSGLVAVDAATPGVVCGASKTDASNLAVAITGADSDGTNSDLCRVVIDVTIASGYKLIGFKLVINGTDVTAGGGAWGAAFDKAGVLSPPTVDYCGASGASHLSLRLKLDPVNSSPSTSYDFTGSQLQAVPTGTFTTAQCLNGAGV